VALSLALALFTLLLAAPAMAKKPPKRAESFQGSCEFAGVARFSPPLGGASQDTTVVATAPGNCTGTFTGRRGRIRQLNKAKALYFATSRGSQSCAQNPGSTGTGFLKMKRSKIGFTMTETRVGPNVSATLTGRAGGTFSGKGMATDDPAATLLTCASPGLSEAGLAFSGSNSSPISG
jgi:hypothetical protein